MFEAFEAFEAMLNAEPAQDINALEPSSAPIKSDDQIRLEWLQQRWGKFTASDFHKLMTCEDKTDLSKGGLTYARKKAVELMTECKANDYISPAMQWGIDHEAEAMDAFMVATGMDVEDCKDRQVFLQMGEDVGGTPDGMIRAIGAGIEIKCPNSETHLEYLETVTDAMSLKSAAPEYYWQVQGLMMITGFEQWYFVSYDPRFTDPALRLHIATIERVPDDIDRLMDRLDQAVAHRDGIVARINRSNTHIAVVKQSLAKATRNYESLNQQIAALMNRVAQLEEIGQKPKRTRTPKPKEQTAEIIEEIPDEIPVDEEPLQVVEDDLDIEDAEGLVRPIDPPMGDGPSAAYADFMGQVAAITTLSDIGRTAHAIKASESLTKLERDDLLKWLAHQQQAIKGL